MAAPLPMGGKVMSTGEKSLFSSRLMPTSSATYGSRAGMLIGCSGPATEEKTKSLALQLEGTAEDILRNACLCRMAVCLHFCKTGKAMEHGSGPQTAWSIWIAYVFLGDSPSGVNCRAGPVGRTQHAVESAGRHAFHRFRSGWCCTDFATESLVGGPGRALK